MIKPKISTKVTGQEKIDRIRKLLAKYKEAYVTIGVHDDAGEYPGSNAPSVIEVALWNEFGTETIPSRPFIRTAVSGNEAKINSWRGEVMDNILFKGWTIEKALEAMGLRIQILIQNQIKSNMAPENAASTTKAKAAKGRPTVTLIDTGLLLRSITYQVHLS